jgi:hypothetical protein
MIGRLSLEALVLASAGCGRRTADKLHDNAVAVSPPTTVSGLDSLLAAVGSVPMQVAANWQVVNEPPPLRAFAALSDASTTLADTAVAHLVACMDRAEPSHATFNGQRLSQGAVCYLMLVRLGAYHEEVGADGGLVATWDGALRSPAASAEQLRRAKMAWQRVVAAHDYHLT